MTAKMPMSGSPEIRRDCMPNRLCASSIFTLTRSCVNAADSAPSTTTQLRRPQVRRCSSEVSSSVGGARKPLKSSKTRQLRRKRTPVGTLVGIAYVKTQPTKLKNSLANVYCFQSCFLHGSSPINRYVMHLSGCSTGWSQVLPSDKAPSASCSAREQTAKAVSGQ